MMGWIGMQRRVRSNTQQGSSYENLLNGFTAALEVNSNEISFALENLAGKEFSESEKKQFKKIQTELKNIDRRLSKLD